MSTDYQAVCDACEQVIHVGQHMGGGHPSFGYGPNDIEGHTKVAGWIFEHVQHGDVRIERGDVVEERVSDGYSRPDWDL